MKKHILWFAFHKDHAGLQLFKYLLCGCIGAAADIVTFYALALFVFPALGDGDILIRLTGGTLPAAADPALIGRNFIFASFGGFLVSGIVSYLLNIWFVFHSDANARHREIFLFLIVSLANIPASTAIGWIALKITGMTTIGFLVKTFFALLFNYMGRKFFVFRAGDDTTQNRGVSS
jgi:putative flippase GtrA